MYNTIILIIKITILQDMWCPMCHSHYSVMVISKEVKTSEHKYIYIYICTHEELSQLHYKQKSPESRAWGVWMRALKSGGKLAQ